MANRPASGRLVGLPTCPVTALIGTLGQPSFVLIRSLIRGIHDRQPSMANFGPDSNGAHRCWFWSLAPPSGIHHSRLFLDSRISLARTTIHSLVYRSGQGPVRRHVSLDFKMATIAFVSRVPAWCGSLRSRSLFVAVVARSMASWSCFRSPRPAGIGSGDNQGNSISPKGPGAAPLAQSHVHGTAVMPG